MIVYRRALPYNLEVIRKCQGQFYRVTQLSEKHMTMDVEIAAESLLKENLCSTCKEEVLDDQQALLCDICEWWEHAQCIKVCDRPTTPFYKVLIESPCNLIVFTCSWCRRKGALAHRLLPAEVALESTQTQRDVYERLLEEKQSTLIACL